MVGVGVGVVVWIDVVGDDVVPVDVEFEPVVVGVVVGVDAVSYTHLTLPTILLV